MIDFIKELDLLRLQLMATVIAKNTFDEVGHNTLNAVNMEYDVVIGSKTQHILFEVDHSVSSAIQLVESLTLNGFKKLSERFKTYTKSVDSNELTFVIEVEFIDDSPK